MRHLLLCLLLVIPQFLKAAPASPDTSSQLRISLLTCATGEELYAAFGHSGVRVINYASGTDEVYNYGTFNFSDPEFYTKFTLGKLLYYIDKSSFQDFMGTYRYEKRQVKEQVLALPDEKKEALLQYLETNLLPENSHYRYDFLFDNCATRIRDLFGHTLGDAFSWGDVLPTKTSYRQAINHYLRNNHWSRFGINLLLGSPVDSVMTDAGAMFLPDFLYRGLENAHYENEPLVAQTGIIYEGQAPESRSLNGPLWTLMGLLILVILAFHVKIFAYLKPVFRFILLFVTGLLGCFMLFMWLGTAHDACNGNYNILWAFPPNLIVAFLAHKQSRFLKLYGLAGMSVLIVALLVHVIGLQRMPLIELSPLLLCLMYCYLDLYKTNLRLPVKKETAATAPEL